ncbi:peptidase T [Mycoplasmatota bacterium]|nr:peptidase T [Mycoplasmatota bacterium]
MMKVEERFLNYVKFDTTANEDSMDCPSSKGQIELAKYIVDELKNLGIKEVALDEFGYIYATIPSNIDKEVPTVGFIAHMDTSPAISGKDIKPRIVKYDNEDIVLNKELNITLSNKEFPNLKQYVGKELIVTDGTTLLGSDDKAGASEIITAVEYLLTHDIKHGTIKIGFTPDEEIGRGADKFDVKLFNADFAYTVDGGVIGELQYENFNAASAKINIQGKSVHPGDAKNKMINASLIAAQIASMFPKDEVPEKTEGYEGFYHLSQIQGNEEKATLEYIIRDFDKDSFENRKTFVKEVVSRINEKYAEPIVKLTLKDQYYNMKEKFENAMYIIDTAKEAMMDVGVEPKIIPIRGGTDGARLSYMGLLTPNIFTGGHNFHGKYEYVPIDSMEKAVEVILKIIEKVIK